MKRSSGILLPIFSLPGSFGLGTLGQEARDFVDFLAQSGQTWWQILPLTPTGGGNSPYTSVSTLAGNPWMIDPSVLFMQNLLSQEELAAATLPISSEIDYQAVSLTREPMLRAAFGRGWMQSEAAVQTFVRQNPWVENYALYMACKAYFDGVSWLDWPEDIRERTPESITKYSILLSRDVAYHTYVQYLFFTQYSALKTYANEKGVSIIGDLPIYVSLDSADVWSERTEFLLEEDGHPTLVAGVPPDYFCEDGQLWGNPLYNWAHQKENGFGWWIRRIEGLSKLCDAIRIDHFRGLDEYWAVPADAETAKEGTWQPGPGMDLLGVLTSWFPQVTYIAEDLGILTQGVHQLRDQAGLPGMRVLEFAFSGPDNLYLPHQYPHHCICYTGTHDNDTILGWFESTTPDEQSFALAYLGSDDGEHLRQAMLRCGHASVAVLFVAQMQDYLALGSEARTNVPGVAEGNWTWRLVPGQIPDDLATQIHNLTARYSRL